MLTSVVLMLTYYFSCYKNSKQKQQSVIDIDNGSIDQVEITNKFDDNIEYEYLNSTVYNI